MLVPFFIVAAAAIVLLVLLVTARQRSTAEIAELTAERNDLDHRLQATADDLATRDGELASSQDRVAELTTEATQLNGRISELGAEGVDLRNQVAEANETVRKRTELADAQAAQIETLSAARDDLQQQLTAAEERIVILAARPGVVVGEGGEVGEDPGAEVLWNLEVARSERSWRNSVAINPVDDPSPFDGADDPVRTAVEIEASALREDVGALIAIEWTASPIVSPARRLLVVRVAQEILAQASRAPGAARLVVTDAGAGDGADDDGQTAGLGGVTMRFEAADENGPALNLIPPPFSADLVDVDADGGLSVTVRAEPVAP